MNKKLFVYGTLMIPEIRRALLQKEVYIEKAYLPGYSANCVMYGADITEYPFLKPNKNKMLKGVVIYPLNVSDCNLLSCYEGAEYEMRDIAVMINREEVEVAVFMLKNTDNIEFGPEWDVEKFVNEHLENYIQKIIPEILLNYYR